MKSLRNDGPFHHKSLLTRSAAVHDLDRIFAGFSFPGQNLHESLSVNLQISFTQFCTYVFNDGHFLKRL